MIRGVEAGLCAALAIGAHLGAFSLLQRDGAEAGGNAGASAITVAAAAPAAAALADVWEAAPEVSAAVAMDAPTPPTLTPAALPQTAPPAQVPPAQTMPAPQSAPTLPRIAAPAPRSVAMPTPQVPAPPEPVAAAPQAAPQTPRAVRPAQMATLAPPPPVQTLPQVDATPPGGTSLRPALRPKHIEAKAPPKPAPRAKPAQTPRAARAASGGARAAAQSGTGQAKLRQAAPQGASKAEIANWGAKIRNRISRRLTAGPEKGRVRLMVHVAADGRVRQVQIMQSSGSVALDRAAVRAARARMPKAPANLGQPYMRFPVTIGRN